MALALACAVSMSAATFSMAPAAQAWEPNKPVNFVIMAGKGGGADKMARFMQAIVQKQNLMPQPLIPDNKGGGSGAEALIAMKTANDPDYNLMVTLNSFFTTPIRQPKLGIDVMTFTPVARMAEDTFILWVNKSEGVKTLDEFVAKAKKMGSEWTMAGTGKGQEDEILTDFLNKTFGLKIKYIPFKGGGAVAKELAGKQVHSTVNNPSEALGFYESGDVVPLVTFTKERLPMFPDVPTMIESGHDFSYYMQRAVVGAPGMSADAAAYYQGVFKKVFDSPEWQGYLKKYSLLGTWIDADQIKAYWKEQIERHKTLLGSM
jgi:tripartite-type tricarboxylate transporter receptor subunit TctC